MIAAGAIFYATICWGSGTSAGDTSRLNKLIRKTGSVIEANGQSGDDGEAQVT